MAYSVVASGKTQDVGFASTPHLYFEKGGRQLKLKRAEVNLAIASIYVSLKIPINPDSVFFGCTLYAPHGFFQKIKG